MRKQLGEGDTLPAFSLPDQDGQPLDSSTLLGKGPIVIFFYPKDETSGCTAEACAFRDQYETFTDAGATVIGISRDDAERHRRFIARYSLPFRLLTDGDGALARRFGVPKALGLISGRSTYVFDARGVLRHQFHGLIQATRHVQEARRVVEELAAAAT
jgi:thioredoxin-dependent peroxiredoxin